MDPVLISHLGDDYSTVGRTHASRAPLSQTYANNHERIREMVIRYEDCKNDGWLETYLRGISYNLVKKLTLLKFFRKKKMMINHVYNTNSLLRTDNARAHTADLYCRWGWEVLFHPSHSPDLSPCDYDLIPKMKEPLRDVRFRTVTDILQAVGSCIRNINRTGAATGILRLPHRWQRVVDNAGYYIEGL
ncbi:hypothetical protein ANN_17103 [Periplaneta americana]|uniref:Tc1-like transposase DDE domain-containing protein n=1 Tax=Periplaneta americana TaxID=6978 RepID=A0ABQ8ST69_PERAM|nr:hypothetical protein ANN_17103 [Periplaneta americana]